MALTPNMEMYLKTILEITGDGGQPRVKAIAERLGVTMPSVSGAVENLQRKGLVEHSPYGTVKLTGKGRRTARRVKDRNDLIYEFLRDVLRLPQDIASQDACELEHVVSRQTLDRFSAFLQFTQVCPLGADMMLKHFGAWLDCAEQDGECTECVRQGRGTRCAS